MLLRPIILLLMMFTAAFATVSCGQKGPLYLPDQTSSEASK